MTSVISKVRPSNSQAITAAAAAAAGSPLDPHNDAYEFLKGMADKCVFDPKEDPLEVLKDGTDAKTILNAAIQREKDSIIFYEGIKIMVPQKFGGARLDEIIAQEMGHVIILTRHLDQIAS